jgi:putative ABC transport system ATP-binding protein
MDIMRRLNQETGVTFVFATHDPRVIAYARRVVTLRDGQIIESVEALAPVGEQG